MKKIFLKISLVITISMLALRVFAWNGMPMPQLHVDGRYLKDTSGHIVNLHGFAQTYSPWFNEQGTKWSNYDVEGCLAYNQGIIDDLLAAGWKMNFVRMHMDPYWSNKPGASVSGEADISAFDFERFKTALDKVFIPMAEYAISKGLYVVMRPPGVCPEKIEIGGDYQKYLIKVWGYVAKHPKLKNNPNIMFELANEPVNILGQDGTYGAGTQGHYNNLTSYFQTITDTIRASANNIIWIPGLGYQSLYAGFSRNPIEGENIGYAVHVYPGWFNSGKGYGPFQQGWDNQVQPAADFAPIIVTEMDWAPKRHEKSWGKDSTGVAGGNGFGANFKKITDTCGNVSWLLFTGPELLAQMGRIDVADDVKDFLTDPEACPTPVFKWFGEYAKEYDFKGVTKDYTTISSLSSEDGENFEVLTNSSKGLKIKAVFADGHSEWVGAESSVSVSDTSVLKIIRGRIFTKKDGQAVINLSYTDALGTKKELKISVITSTFPFTEQLFNPDIWENGTFDESTRTLKTGPWGFGGWQYDGIDLSEYKYIVARLAESNAADVSFNVYDGPSYWGSPVAYKFGDKQEVVVPLKYAFKNDKTAFNPEHIYIAGFWSNGGSSFAIDTVFLTNSSDFDYPVLVAKDDDGNELSKIEGLNYKFSGGSIIRVFRILGDLLNGDVTISAPANFEISLSKTDGFSSSLTINPQNGLVSETEIFVRLKADLEKKTYSGSLTITADGLPTKKVTLSGKAEQTVGVRSISNDSQIVSKEYYSITGQKIQSIENWKGLYVEKDIFSDGNFVTYKKIKIE